MGEVLAFLTFVAVMAALLGGLWWLGARARRRGIGGEFIGVFNELYHPAAHQVRFEVVEQRTAPTPDDGWSRRRRRGDRPGVERDRRS